MEDRWGQALMGSFWACLACAPLPLGSNRWWALGLLAFWVWATLGLAVGRSLWTRQWPALWQAGGRQARWPLLMLAGLAVLPALQLAQGLGATADVFQTRVYLLTALTYLGAGLLVVHLCTTPARVKGTLLVLVLGALLQAVLAILLFSGRGKYTLFFFEFVQGQRATGTFPNPDHLAGYMEMGLAAGLGLMLVMMGPGSRKGGADGAVKAAVAGASQTAPQAWLKRLRPLLDFVMSSKMILRMGLVVMVMALVMTHSRMGNAAFFAALVVVGAALAVQSPKMRKAALWLVLSVVVIDVVVIGQWVGLEKVMDRLQQTDMSVAAVDEAGSGPVASLTPPTFNQAEETLGERLRAPRLTLNLIAERPLAGFGGGSFFTVFPPYKTPDMPWYWQHTHNDYLQMAAELGLPGLALFLALGLLVLWRSWPRLKDQASSLERGVAVACGLGLVALGLHSLVDFNLQIPANALTLTTLLCLAWAPGLREQRRSAGRSATAAGRTPDQPGWAPTQLGAESAKDDGDNVVRPSAMQQPGAEE